MAKRGRKPIGKEKMVSVGVPLAPATRAAVKTEAALTGEKPAAFCRTAIEKLLKVRRLARNLNEHREGQA